MPFLTSVALTSAGALLNDPNNTTYTHALLLPHIQNAWLRLEMKFILNNLPTTEKMTAVLAVPVNTLIIGDGTTPALPADLIVPYTVWEKPDGSAITDFVTMIEVGELPTRDQDTTLLEWKWRENEIHLVGATAINDIQISYLKHLTRITSTGTNIFLMETQLYLAAQTASFAALIQGGNQGLSASLQQMADDQLSKIIRTRVKATQNITARRRPYGYYRRVRRNDG